MLPETTFRATAEASATAMANPRRRSRFRATAKASATASLALASVVLALGGGRTGFPKQVSERCKAEGSWTASGRNGRFINQKRTSGQIFKFGLRMADFILSRIRSLSAAKPSHFYQGLAEWQRYEGRPAALAVYQSRLSRPASLWPLMAALSSLRTRPVAAMAVLSIRSVQMARSVDLGCGWSISYCPAQAVYQRPVSPQWPLYQS